MKRIPFSDLWLERAGEFPTAVQLRSVTWVSSSSSRRASYERSSTADRLLAMLEGPFRLALVQHLGTEQKSETLFRRSKWIKGAMFAMLATIKFEFKFKGGQLATSVRSPSSSAGGHSSSLCRSTLVGRSRVWADWSALIRWFSANF